MSETLPTHYDANLGRGFTMKSFVYDGEFVSELFHKSRQAPVTMIGEEAVYTEDGTYDWNAFEAFHDFAKESWMGLESPDDAETDDAP